nr:TPA_asm: hypothetical protein HUJ06_000339 [Nelumbo nucifera]
MVALVGAHTIGMARCVNFRERIYGDFQETAGSDPLSETYLSSLKSTCPPTGADDNIAALDYLSPNLFEVASELFSMILQANSDQPFMASSNAAVAKWSAGRKGNSDQPFDFETVR